MTAKRLRNALIALAAVCVGWYVISDAVFEEDNITLLGGKYYTASLDSGTALHWYENPDKPYGEPLLEKVYEASGNKSYLVVRAGTDSYFMFPWQTDSIAEAKRKRLGPFPKAKLKSKLLQLSSDTTLHPISIL